MNHIMQSSKVLTGVGAAALMAISLVSPASANLDKRQKAACAFTAALFDCNSALSPLADTNICKIIEDVAAAIAGRR